MNDTSNVNGTAKTHDNFSKNYGTKSQKSAEKGFADSLMKKRAERRRLLLRRAERRKQLEQHEMALKKREEYRKMLRASSLKRKLQEQASDKRYAQSSVARDVALGSYGVELIKKYKGLF